jgi:uncharacterized membrane protein (DUF2068 family)
MRAIVLYKLIKAGVQLVLAALLVALGTDGIGSAVESLAESLRRHATEGWTVALLSRAGELFTPRHIAWTAAALIGDAVLSAIEGTLLARGVSWAPWLVAGAVGLLLPWELFAFCMHPAAGRLILFLVNAAIVAYLVWYASKHHRRLSSAGA